ncbi:quinon protein alcohol dehydrogenase-like superfamily [Lipomyces arxii]|uniref:quinon protein alcohol dehydrogenase-like superfamily n=1 Tax=Lipomyces arxii TaxID=56418 RepID=UPI0034D0217A
MDFHRCRFLDYISHSITALAFSHSSVSLEQQAPKTLRLAVGRANGDIEIWNPRANWIHEITLKGGRDRSIEGLVWVQSNSQPRLFSIGGSTVVTEWNLETGLPLYHHDCDAGIVWSVAASPDGSKLAAGCDDGSIVIIDISGGVGSMELSRLLQRQKSRVLSIAWRGNSQVVGGCVDGRIRVWAAVAAAAVGEPNGTVATSKGAVGRIIGTMRVDKAQGEETLVWSVAVLKNGRTIVSGDSTGTVKFWDAAHFSLLQTFKVHEGDVLCLASNEAADTVFSAGIDRKIVKYSIIDPKLRRWANMSSRLLHSHDIRAMAAYESQNYNLLISGGVERSIVVNSVTNFFDGVFRKITVPPEKHRIHNVGSRKLIALWSDNQVKLWEIERFPCAADNASVLEGKNNRRLVASLTLSNDENITHVALSPDAKYLAVGSNAETKLFLLIPSKQSRVFKVKKILSPELNEQGSTALAFDPSGQNLVIVNAESEIYVYSTSDQDEPKAVSYSLSSEADEDGTEFESGLSYLDKINNLAFSEDGKYLAVATLSGNVQVYDWVTQSHLWTLPRIPEMPSVLQFSPDNDSLIIVTSQMHILQFSVQEQGLTDWSRRNMSVLPREFNRLIDKCSGMYIDVESPDHAYMWGASWVAKVDMGADIPVFRIPKRKHNGIAMEKTSRTKKSKVLNKLEK